MNNVITLFTVCAIIILNSVDRICDYFEPHETFMDSLRYMIFGYKKERTIPIDFRDKIKKYGKILFQVIILFMKFVL